MWDDDGPCASYRVVTAASGEDGVSGVGRFFEVDARRPYARELERLEKQGGVGEVREVLRANAI